MNVFLAAFSRALRERSLSQRCTRASSALRVREPGAVRDRVGVKSKGHLTLRLMSIDLPNGKENGTGDRRPNSSQQPTRGRSLARG